MILPPDYTAAGPATSTLTYSASSPSPTSLIPKYGSEEWSSLIGIITAIVGNILISFALNTQRYAHIRLEREWQEKERLRKKRSASYRNSRRKYHPPRHAEYTVESERDAVDEGAVATEADPLLPNVASSQGTTHSRSRPTLKTTNTSTTDDGTTEEAYKQKSYLKSPYWWAGIILMTTGEAGNFLAYGFAPASIVSPLGVVALISNCIIAPFMLKEPFRARDGIGVIVAVAGAVTVVASASDNNPKLGPDEIWDLITTWEFETYLGITIAVIMALMAASNKFGEKSILIDLGLVGLFGGYTALSTKGVASMLSYTLWRAITFPVTYLLVAILVFTAIMQIKYVNRALQRFDATQVIPVQFVLFTLSVILGSAILYRDFERTSGGDAGKFVGGCAMTFAGVWLITSGRTRSRDDNEEDREPEPEDAINLVNGERYHDNIDGTGDHDVGSSRRSSTIRAASPPIDIRRRTSHDISQPSTPRRPLAGHYSYQELTRPQPLPDASSSLTSNPWENEEAREAANSPSPGPTPVSRSSLPVLPSEATISPPPASTSSPDLPIHTPPLPPQTPTRGISDNIIQQTPQGASTLPSRLRRMGTAERLSSRNSLTTPLLASPLSTGLNAMVADLKRGGSLRMPPSHRNGGNEEAARRRESVLGIGASEVEEEVVGEPLDRRRTATDDVPSVNTTNRQRSLSGTLNDLWRGLRGPTTNAEAAQSQPELGSSQEQEQGQDRL